MCKISQDLRMRFNDDTQSALEELKSKDTFEISRVDFERILDELESTYDLIRDKQPIQAKEIEDFRSYLRDFYGHIWT